MQFSKRLRNKLFVTSLISFIILLAKTFNLFEVPSNIDTLVDMLLGILSGAGILIDPTTPGFTDKDM